MFTGNEDNTITLSEGTALTHRFQLLFPGLIKATYVSKASLQALLAQDGIVGARIYFGLTSDLKMTHVMVGVDANELDKTDGVILDKGTACPPSCSTNIVL